MHHPIIKPYRANKATQTDHTNSRTNRQPNGTKGATNRANQKKTLLKRAFCQENRNTKTAPDTNGHDENTKTNVRKNQTDIKSLLRDKIRLFMGLS